MEKARNTEEEKKMGQKWVKKKYKASETRINTGFPADTSTLSPMMKEYVKTKEEYSDCILFYRLGALSSNPQSFPVSVISSSLDAVSASSKNIS